jgi:hypothetical protein
MGRRSSRRSSRRRSRRRRRRRRRRRVGGPTSTNKHLEIDQAA